ncbi:MAG: hypothetical protein AAF679_05210, partial [Pseudomonadota bacterium]
MHKTGSSSLQRVFSRNRWVLALAGIHYWAPKTGAFKRASKATDLYSAITHEASGQGPHPQFGPAEKILEAIAERGKRQTVLVSAEGLSGQDPAYSRAFALLKGQVQVVLYLRRQDHWVESFYRQMVRSMEVAERRPFEAFLADPWTNAHLDFLALADRWADAV